MAFDNLQVKAVEGLLRFPSTNVGGKERLGRVK